METAISRQKANDLQTLITSLNNQQNQKPSATDIQIMNIIEDYFIDSQQELQKQIEQFTQSKITLIESTNKEIDRMRYLIHQLTQIILKYNPSQSPNNNNAIQLNSADHTAPASPQSRTKSLTFSPLILPEPDIDVKPLDLQDVPSKFRPRRYSTIPDSYTGKFKIEIIKKGNNHEFPYPNDKVTVQYTMFAIHKSLVFHIFTLK